MARKTLLVTTALVFCVSASFAGQEPGKNSPPFTAAAAGWQPESGTLPDHRNAVDRNAQFAAWFGYRGPHKASRLLYEQSASSGFSNDAVSSWKNDSAYGGYTSSTIAADDFTIPGTGTHTITAVYAPGTGEDLNYVNVTFYYELKYNKGTGRTTAVVKASCDFMPVTMSNGSVSVDLSTCSTGRFRAGHDYAISIQGLSPGPPIWAWQTNRHRIGREAFWMGNNSECAGQLTPIKICFPEKGYGPDLAFAIYGN